MNRSQRVAAIGISFGSLAELRAEIEAIATDQSTTFYLNSGNELTSRVADVARAICPGLYLARREGHRIISALFCILDDRNLVSNLHF